VKAPVDLSAGQVLAGRFRVERTLGIGGMGAVVAATHLGLGQLVAVKVMLSGDFEIRESTERFLREARIAGRLRGEHIVQVKDVGTLDNGTPFIVMEFLEGDDLSTLVRSGGPLEAVEAVELVLQACEGLAEAHAQGIVHRDLKPPNLFLTRHPNGAPLLKVLDFGISKSTQTSDVAATKTATVMGSANYMSPEQVRSARQADVRSDIWSLGVVLYELLSGGVPFDGESFTDICVRIAVEPARPLNVPNLAFGLQSVVYRCLEKEPARRFQSVAELAYALAPFGGMKAFERAESVGRILGVPLTQFAVAAPGARALPESTTLRRSSGQRVELPRANAGRRVGAWLLGGAIAAGATVAILGSMSGDRSARELRPANAKEVTTVPVDASAPIATPSIDAAPAATREIPPSPPDPEPQASRAGSATVMDKPALTPAAVAPPRDPQVQPPARRPPAKRKPVPDRELKEKTLDPFKE
jgi:eukaryotic-like serine/threonine-protein kinase